MNVHRFSIKKIIK